MIEDLIAQGTITQCKNSLVNAPVLPVKKPDGSWGVVQDQCLVNSSVHSRAPISLKLSTVLSRIPLNSQWFTMIDLVNAFFSFTVDKDF